MAAHHRRAPARAAALAARRATALAAAALPRRLPPLAARGVGGGAHRARAGPRGGRQRGRAQGRWRRAGAPCRERGAAAARYLPPRPRPRSRARGGHGAPSLAPPRRLP